MSERLPGVLAEIAAVAGEAAALAIAEARGGTQIYVPPAPPPGHWLCELVGEKAAQAIADRLTCGVGGRRVDLPLGPCGHQSRARVRVDRMLMAERSERDIALATGYTTRGVRKRRAQLRDSRQPRLL